MIDTEETKKIYDAVAVVKEVADTTTNPRILEAAALILFNSAIYVREKCEENEEVADETLDVLDNYENHYRFM